MLQLDDIHKSYGSKQVLTAVDLTIADGEICCVIGLNGAGKTTTISIATGLVEPTAGEVRIGPDGAGPRTRQAKRLMGVAGQDIGLYRTRSVRANLRFFADLYGLDRRQADAAIDAAVADLALDAFVDDRVANLSGGQQRRVHIACALLHDPAVVLLDEPTTGIDIETRGLVLAKARRLADDGASVLFTTHHLAEVGELDATVAVLHAGQILHRGSARDFIAMHGEPYLELEFGRRRVLAGRLDGATEGDGPVWRVYATDPARAIREVLAALTTREIRDIVRVEAVEPTLENVVRQHAQQPLVVQP